MGRSMPATSIVSLVRGFEGTVGFGVTSHRREYNEWQSTAGTRQTAVTSIPPSIATVR
jgi:hypothetical protein